jgi:tetratricopeptide (TPR) repeat protein
LKGWAFYRLSDADAVLALGEQAQKLCSQFGNQSGLATSFKLLGVAHLQLGQFPQADRFFEQGLAIYEKVDDRRNIGAMLSNLGESARSRGNYRRAEELYEKAIAAMRQIGHRDSESIYLSNLSAARLGLCKFQQAEADAREALTVVEGLNFCAHAETYAFLSEACLGQGKLRDALDAADRALAMASESENDLDLGIAWRTLGKVLAACRKDQFPVSANGAVLDKPRFEPDACFQQSHQIFNKIDAEGESAGTLRAWAEFDLQNGRDAEGKKRLEEAQTILRRLGAVTPNENEQLTQPGK